MFEEYPREKKEQNQLIFGIRAIMEAVLAGKDLESIFVQKGLNGDLWAECRVILTDREINFQYVPIEKLNRLTLKNHQGVVGYISPIEFQKIELLLPEIYEKGEIPLLLILDRITDVRNFGAIVRTAACAGVHAIIIPSRGSAQINPDAIKTSAGALLTLPICREINLKTTISFLKDSGLQIIGCTEKTNDLLYKTDFQNPTAVILGSEEDGISGEYLAMCDGRAGIPLAGELASLNVSVAAGVILYEAVRQRKT